MSRALSLFGEMGRLQMTDSIELTARALTARAATHPHWVVAWSGGKDSTTVLTLTVELIRRGMVPAPASLSVLYADTRMELLPLATVAADVRDELDARGIDNRVVMAPLDKRFLVYMLGRGVPPPNNGTFRWCTRQIKIDPMATVVDELAVARRYGSMEPNPRGGLRYVGNGSGKLLVLTGVRQGESAARDERIAASCSKDGGECGQGRFQEALADASADTLDPILHWRICHVWEWLWTWAPEQDWGGWETRALAEAYGGRDGDEAVESAARTGCVGCPLATRDLALEGLLRSPRWDYLRPLTELRPLWRELREPRHRLRKDGSESRTDGTLVDNPGRMGPLKLPSRLYALDRVLDVQGRVNAEAMRRGRPCVDMLNAEEEARIRELIAAGTWPQRWSGDELSGDAWIEADHGRNAVLFRPGVLS